jgi:hypothetical protein
MPKLTIFVTLTGAVTCAGETPNLKDCGANERGVSLVPPGERNDDCCCCRPSGEKGPEEKTHLDASQEETIIGNPTCIKNSG